MNTKEILDRAREALEALPDEFVYRRIDLRHALDELERSESNRVYWRDEYRESIRILETRIATLKAALERIAEGCSFPEDDVQRAVRDVARAALEEK